MILPPDQPSFDKKAYVPSREPSSDLKATLAKVSLIALGLLIVGGGVALHFYGPHLASSFNYWSVASYSIMSLGGALAVTVAVYWIIKSVRAHCNQKQIQEKHELVVNLERAFEKHGTSLESVGIDLSYTKPKELTFSHGVAEDIGARFERGMEDGHFFLELEGGVLAGVIDGHSDGGEGAKLIKRHIEKIFSSQLEEHGPDMQKVFNETFRLINEQFREKHTTGIYDYNGALGTICYIDQETNMLYTATLGDTEAKIYRKAEEERVVSIPISVPLSWSDPSEKKRAAELGLDVEDDRGVTRVEGTVASRTWGDFETRGSSAEPVISAIQLKPGDRLVIGCDGLWDYYGSEEEYIESVVQPNWEDPNQLAKESKNLSLSNQEVTIYKTDSTAHTSEAFEVSTPLAYQAQLEKLNRKAEEHIQYQATGTSGDNVTVMAITV